MTNNKYIVLNSTNGSNCGGLAIFSDAIGNTNLSISTFGLKDVENEVVVDDLVFVRQFSLKQKTGQFVIERNINDFSDIVVGIFNKDRRLVLAGSTIGIETKEQRNRLEIALENKCALKHFGELAKQAIVKANKTFFDEVVLLLFDLFACGLPDNNLQKLIPNSKWVKVFCEKDVIAVGVVERNGKLSEVGLAFPVICKRQTRAEIDSNFSFLPLCDQNPNGFGYYVVLQRAKDGVVVPMNA